MNGFKRRLTILALIGSFTGLAIPVDAEDVRVLGAGASSCGSWIQERPTSLYYQNSAWIQGYLRGWIDAALLPTSVAGLQREAIPDPVRTLDAAAISSWIDQYCDTHRLDSLYYAANALAIEVLKRATK